MTTTFRAERFHWGDDAKFNWHSKAKAFDPSEPRDPQGRWTEDGAGNEGAPKLPGLADVPPYAGRRTGDKTNDGTPIRDYRADPKWLADKPKLKNETTLTTVLTKPPAKDYFVREWATVNDKGEPKQSIYVDTAGRMSLTDVGWRHEKDPHQETVALR